MEMIAEYTELEKNGYILNAYLTQLVLPEYMHEIADDNLVFKIENKCRENGYIKKTEILKEVIKAFYRYKVDANATNDELDLAISKIIGDCLAACLTLEQIFFIVCHEMGHQKMYKLYHAEKDLNSNTKEETTNSNTHLFKVAK